MGGAIPPLLLYVFMAWCLVKHRDLVVFISNQKQWLYSHELVSVIRQWHVNNSFMLHPQEMSRM
jgi:hypothetical protein